MDRTAARRDRLACTLKADRADALLVTAPANVRYLTGFTGEDATLLVTETRSVVVSDGRFTTQLGQECPGLESYIRPRGWCAERGRL
jgi:Xaa-Pro aminopeptidase